MATWSDRVPAADVDARFLSAEYHAPHHRELEQKLRRALHCVPLASLAKDLFQGWSPRGGVKGGSGIPAIKTKNLSSCSVSYEMDCAELSDVAVPDRAWAVHGDIYVLRCAHHPRYIGKDIGRYDNSHPLKPFITEKIIVARGVAPCAHDGYVTAFLQTHYGYQQIQRRLGGLTANYTPDDFGRVLVPLPDRRVQDYIGAKVELAEQYRATATQHRRRVATLLDEVVRESAFTTHETPCRWVPGQELQSRWMNAGFYRKSYADLSAHLRDMGVVVAPLGALAACNREKVKPTGVISYIEISDVDSEEGSISASRECLPLDTPNNAQRVLEHGDIVMSTRRPDRGAVALARKEHAGAFCSVFLARIQCTSAQVVGRYLQEYLRTRTGRLFIAQRCTETTYPVISEDDIETIPVAIAPRALQEEIAQLSLKAELLRVSAGRLVREAQSDVEALIAGTLDTNAIITGRVKPPTAEDVAEEAERTA